MLTLRQFGVTAVLTASIAMPATAAAQGQDLRNPDRRVPAVQQTQDLRNPDRRAPGAPAPPQDLRNPDRRGPAASEIPAVDAPVVTTIEAPADGFDWTDAGIGAAGGMAVLGLLVGLTLAVTHRRRGSQVTAATRASIPRAS
jgi:hypothetical protein